MTSAKTAIRQVRTAAVLPAAVKSHDFRKRAVTEAHRAGLDVDTAAAAVGMSPSTARGYYLAMDQEKAAAQLAQKLANTLRPKNSTT